MKGNKTFLIKGIIMLLIIGIITAAYFISTASELKLLHSKSDENAPVHLTIVAFDKAEGKNRIKYALVNNSPTGIITGEGYQLYRKENGGWVEKNDMEPVFIAIAYMVNPQDRKEFNAVLDWMTKDIKAGEYKLSKGYTVNDGSSANGLAEAEFTLGR